MRNDWYYYGNYTPDGWASIIKKTCLCEYRKISVCGYPNCVKQQLFRRIASILSHKRIKYTDLTIANGSMGILCEKLKFIVVDGELVTLENSEIINVYDFVRDSAVKENEAMISKLNIERKRTEMRCERFLTACKSITDDMRRLDMQSVDTAKLNRFSSRLWKKYGGKPTGKVGLQEKRFVSCITKDGVELNMGAFDALCDKIIVIYDKTGACSAPVIDKVRSYALGSGYDVTGCICPVNLELEHIIVPQLKFGIFTSRYYHRADFKNCEKVYSSKFHTFNSAGTVQRIEFSSKVYKAMMNEAFDCVGKLNCIDEKMNRIPVADKTELFRNAEERIFR